MKRISFHIFIAVILLLPFIAVRFQNKQYDRLSGKDGRLTIAHVYKMTVGSRGSKSYHYFYKVNNQLYYSSPDGWNVGSFYSEPIKSFIIVYDKKKPSRNAILWDKKLEEFKELGASIPSIKNQDKIIKRHTLSLRASSDVGRKNHHEELKEYERQLYLHFENLK
jgi:hypothetical protein